MNNVVEMMYKEVTVTHLVVVTAFGWGRAATKMSVTVVPVWVWTGELRNTNVPVRRSFRVLTEVVLLQTGISSNNLWVHEFQNIPQFTRCISETLLHAFQLTHFSLFLNISPPHEIMYRKLHCALTYIPGVNAGCKDALYSSKNSF